MSLSKTGTRTLHADGYLSFDKVKREEESLDLAAIRDRCSFYADANGKAPN